jgi:hypothetical protein
MQKVFVCLLRECESWGERSGICEGREFIERPAQTTNATLLTPKMALSCRAFENTFVRRRSRSASHLMPL